MELVLAAGAVPDEPRRIELRKHRLLLEPEQAAVERPRLVHPLGRDRDRDVMEPHPQRARLRRRTSRPLRAIVCDPATRGTVRASVAPTAQAPRAAYTSSYARTASIAACAARSAAPSIREAAPSMNRHCSTDRLTAATASSVYGYRSKPSRSPLAP